MKIILIMTKKSNNFDVDKISSDNTVIHIAVIYLTTYTNTSLI